MPAQDKLTQTEQYLAYLAGLGIVIAIAALLLTGLGTIENDNITISLLLVGLAMIILGIGGWLILVRPWEHFDDLKTPHYTGHEDHAHAEAEAPALEAASEIAVAPEVAVAQEVAVAPKTEAAVVVVPKVEAALKVAVTPKGEIVPVEEAEAKAEPVAKPAAKPAPKAETPAAETVATPAAKPEPKAKAAKPKAKPAKKAKAAPAEPDELTLIEGIGPKSAAALNDAGITTFAQIAEMEPAALEDAIKSRKVRLVGSTETWPRQAKLAAAGDLSALDALKARIKGGILQDE